MTRDGAVKQRQHFYHHGDTICPPKSGYVTTKLHGTSTCQTVFCPGLKKGMVLLEEKGHFCLRNYILRALSRAELFSEGTLHKLWATHPMFEM